MKPRRKKLKLKFLRRHRLAFEAILIVSLVVSTSSFILFGQLRGQDEVIGGISYSFSAWGPTREVRYDFTIRTTENTPAMLIYYYVPTTGLNQRVLSDHVMYIVSPTEPSSSREVRNIDGDSVVIWYLTGLGHRSEVRINHVFRVQTRSFTSKPHHSIPRENNVGAWLGPTALINADDENILKLAAQLKKDSRWDTAKKIHEWAQNNIGFRSTTLARRRAVDVLLSKQGDCDDVNGLAASLARAKDIPSRIVIGTYKEAHYVPFHAWTETYTEYGWIVHDVINKNIPFGSLTTDYIRIYYEPNTPVTPADLGYIDVTNTTAAGPVTVVGWQGPTMPLADWSVSVVLV